MFELFLILFMAFACPSHHHHKCGKDHGTVTTQGEGEGGDEGGDDTGGENGHLPPPPPPPPPH